MTRQARIAAAVIAMFIIVFGVFLHMQAGIVPVFIIIGSAIIGYVIWLSTTARRPAEPSLLLPYYLATLGFLYVHILEEYIFDFAGRVGALFGSGWDNHGFAILLGTTGPFVWTMAAIGIWRRHPVGNFFALFIFVGMIIGEPMHLVWFPVLEGGRYHYFPGMWTSLLPMAPAIAGFVAIMRDHFRAVRTSAR